MTKTIALTAVLAASLAFLTLSARAQEATTPAQAAAPAKVLGLCDIESRLGAEGITIRELEIRDAAVEVEGRDAQGRKVELLVDRRTGEILSRKLDR